MKARLRVTTVAGWEEHVQARTPPLFFSPLAPNEGQPDGTSCRWRNGSTRDLASVEGVIDVPWRMSMAMAARKSKGTDLKSIQRQI